MNILIADDDRIQTLMISTRLKARGFNVVVAYDAIQAYTAAIRSLPDAIILDIQMPGGTGVSVLKHLKASAKTSQIPVIVLTGTLDPSEEPELRELGVAQFLYKPVDLEQVYFALSQLVDKDRDASATR